MDPKDVRVHRFVGIAICLLAVLSGLGGGWNAGLMTLTSGGLVAVVLSASDRRYYGPKERSEK